MKVIGIRPSSFPEERGDTVSGKNIYLTYPLETGEGQGSEWIFVTDAKAGRKRCGRAGRTRVPAAIHRRRR